MREQELTVNSIGAYVFFKHFLCCIPYLIDLEINLFRMHIYCYKSDSTAVKLRKARN
jgi:hypothetical protein